MLERVRRLNSLLFVLSETIAIKVVLPPGRESVLLFVRTTILSWFVCLLVGGKRQRIRLRKMTKVWTRILIVG
jgi:hypothetical protein